MDATCRINPPETAAKAGRNSVCFLFSAVRTECAKPTEYRAKASRRRTTCMASQYSIGFRLLRLCDNPWGPHTCRCAPPSPMNSVIAYQGMLLNLVCRLLLVKTEAPLDGAAVLSGI